MPTDILPATINPMGQVSSDLIPMGVTLDAIGMAVKKVVEACSVRQAEIFTPLELVKADPSIDVLLATIESFNGGKPLQGQLDQLQKLTSKQDTKAEIVSRLALNHDFSRFAKFLQAREKIETGVLDVANKGTLNAAESLALLSYLNQEISKSQTKISGSSVSSKDVTQLVEQMSFLVGQEDNSLQRKLKDATPQSREIIRRLAHKIAKVSGK